MRKLPPLSEALKSIKEYGKTDKLTGIKDVDLLILKELSDKDLFQMCLVNKSVNRACKDEYFWRERFLKTFSNSQELLKYKKEGETWRQYYLKFIYYTSEYNAKPHLIRQASFDGDLSLVVYAALKDPNSIHTLGDLPLQLANQGGYYDIMKFLISKGSIVNVNNGTILIWNCAHGTFDIVKFLVEHGADIHSQEDAPIRWAAKGNKIDMVKYLIEKGANIHPKNEEVLRWFSKKGDVEMVKYLIGQGAIPNPESRAVEEAINGGHLNLVQYFLENGFDTEYNLDNNYLMKVAVNSFSLPVVKYLVGRGYPVTSEIIEEAKKKGYIQIVDFLKTKMKQ